MLIQRGVMTPATPDGVIRLLPDGHAALTRHLQSLYGPDGRPHHAFIMLRLNPDAPMPVARNAPLIGYRVIWPTPGDRRNTPTLWIRQ